MTIAKGDLDVLPGPVTDDQRATEPQAFALLLARVEAVDGPDPVIDLDLWCATAALHNLTITQAPFTASLDAALALCSRVLPGLNRNMWDFRDRGWGARLTDPENGQMSVAYHCYSQTPALALIAAILKALLSKGDGVSSRNRGDETRSQSQPSGRASADAEVSAGRNDADTAAGEP